MTRLERGFEEIAFAWGLAEKLEPHFGTDDWNLSGSWKGKTPRVEVLRWDRFGSADSALDALACGDP